MTLDIEENIFKAYLKGGLIWPQQRFAINIFVMLAMADITDDPYNTEQTTRFLNSEFSDKQ